MSSKNVSGVVNVTTVIKQIREKITYRLYKAHHTITDKICRVNTICV